MLEKGIHDELHKGTLRKITGPIFDKHQRLWLLEHGYSADYYVRDHATFQNLPVIANLEHKTNKLLADAKDKRSGRRVFAKTDDHLMTYEHDGSTEPFHAVTGIQKRALGIKPKPLSDL
ncbi:MAG: hypothetical protein K9G62_05670 [Alphaproteobacteria bacterium]|nr:hypothetical protein [Alphaproteobacteria bacterium]